MEFEKSLETVRNGFATPHLLRGLPGKLSGCIYRSDTTKVHLSERFGGFMGDTVQSENSETIERSAAQSRLQGRGVYLGHYMGGHYGHFITETLSTFWVFEEHSADSFDYFLFHPFVFGERVPNYVDFCFHRFGVPRDKIVFVGSEQIDFDELLVPERLLRLNHSADVQSRWVYRHIGEGSRAPSPVSPNLYLSRRRFSRGNFERVVANEIDMEVEFHRRGFNVIYPETLSFEEQVGYYSRADCIAGISGSGLHNSLFLRPGARVIELGDPRYEGEPAPTQALCDHISGARNAFIPFQGPRFGRRGTMLFDMQNLRTRLDVILGTSPAVECRGPWRRLADLMEIGYLCIRPSVGSIARRILHALGHKASVRPPPTPAHR